MAEENKENKEAKKEGAEAKPEEQAAKKGGNVFYIGIGGGAAVVIGMAYFLTVAAVNSDAQVAVAPVVEEKHEEPEKAAEGHGEKKEGEHGAKEEGHGEGGEKGKEAEKGTGEVTRVTVELKEIEANPAGTGLKRLFNGQFGIVLEAPDAAKYAEKLQSDAEINLKLVDGLLTLIKSKQLPELEGEGNIKVLKREIGNLINRLLFPNQEGKVAEVLVIRFVIQ